MAHNKNMENKSKLNKKLFRLFIILCVLAIFIVIARIILNNYLEEYNDEIKIYEYNIVEEI